MGKRPLSSGSSKKNSWVLITHANAPLQSCPSMRPNPGTFPIWNSKGLLATVINMALRRRWFPKKSAKSRGRGEIEERCAAILFGTTMVMAVRTFPDSKKSLEMYGRRGADENVWPLMLAGVRQGLWRFQQSRVVWDYERI